MGDSPAWLCWDPVLHSPISFNQGNAQLCPGPGSVTGGLMAWHTQPRWQPGLRWPRSSSLPNANCISFLQERQEGKGLAEHSCLHYQPQTSPGPAIPWAGLHQPQISATGGMNSVPNLMVGFRDFLGANNVSKEFHLGDSILPSRGSYPPKCREAQNPGLCDQGTSISYSINLTGVNIRGKMVYSCPAQPNERRGILLPACWL